MKDIFARLTDTSGFMPRRICGIWSPELIRLHNISDFLIWLAYLAIPVVLISFAYRRRHELPFRQVFWLFGLFIIACGTTHLMDIVLFYWPAYRLSGIIKMITAAASWGTVFALLSVVPRALAMRSPEDLQREIDERERAEALVRQLNCELENRVALRTMELAQANCALEAAMQVKDEFLARETRARAQAEAAQTQAEAAQTQAEAAQTQAEAAQTQAEAARVQAEVANRAKDEFLATLSHELRTPINSIQGWAYLLQTGKLDSETTSQALDSIFRVSQSQTQMVMGLLDVSSIITGKMRLEPQPVQLSPLIEAALTAIRPAAQAKRICLTAHFDREHGEVLADADRIQQILWNLLANALKFTPEKGRIEVTLREGDSNVEIAVTDTGAGIAPEVLPFIFDRFRQGDSSDTRAHGGLGLGLSIVRHLAELHGGTVQARSAGVGKGATFTLCLPRMAMENGGSRSEFEAARS